MLPEAKKNAKLIYWEFGMKNTDIVAGIGSGLATLPLVIAGSHIAFGITGLSTATALIAMVFAAHLVAGLVGLFTARCPILILVPSVASLLAAAGIFSTLVADGHTPGVAEVMAIVLVVSFITALFQGLLILLGAAALGPLAPYPVVSGLVNGTALLVLMSQLGLLSAYPMTILVAGVTIGVMFYFPPRWRIPPVLPAVMAGMLTHWALTTVNVPSGPMMSGMPSLLSYWIMAQDAWSLVVTRQTDLPWSLILAASISIAVLSLLESLGTLSALTDRGIVAQERRDLTTIAAANVAVGLAAAGPPVSAPPGGAMVLLGFGGHTRAAAAIRLVTLAIVGVLLGPFLDMIPQAVIAGIVLTVGLRLIDPEPVRLLWRALHSTSPHRVEIAFSAIISLNVVIVATWWGLAPAVGAGAIACLVLFTAAMAGNAVRRIYDGASAQSRVRRSPTEIAILARDRRQIAVLELAGPLFFGNINPLRKVLEQLKDARYVVIDLSRIPRVDLSGARRLLSIVSQARAAGRHITLAPVHPGNPVTDYLVALGTPPAVYYSEVTAAIAHAENAILTDAGVANPTYDTAEAALCAFGVSVEHAAAIANIVHIRDLNDGEVLCRRGDAAEDVFVLMRGRADVVLAGEGGETVVLAHLTAGAMIGERALFEAGTRSADVICTEASRVLLMSGAALRQTHSSAAHAVILAIARHMSVSLEQANSVIQRLEM